MNLDLRIPMGLMFTLVGVILSAFGWATAGNAMYVKSGGYNANLDWGLVLLVFGGVMFMLGRRGQKKLLSEASKSEAIKPAAKGAVRRGH
jgi:hypothetical protein